MYTTHGVEAPSSSSLVPLTPFCVRGTVRYGLMRDDGRYFVHAHLRGGRWCEWDHSPHDAHSWISIDRAADAARVWHATHGEALTVVVL